MILAYTTNEAHVGAIQAAAELKDYDVEVQPEIDADALLNRIEELNVLVFDLTTATMSADKVVSTLDAIDSELIPPVLYLLANAADIHVVTQAGSIVNQDYSFIPINPEGLAARLEVLTILGARRRLTMETAITDRLTGLYNRKYFLRRLEEELYRSARYSYGLCVLLTSVDFDTEDHELDEDTATSVLKQVGDFFQDRLRRSDIVARYKWDDFALLLPDIAVEDGLAVAKDVKSKIESAPVQAGDSKVTLAISVGHVHFPADGLSTAIDVATALEDCAFKAKRENLGLVSYTPEK